MAKIPCPLPNLNETTKSGDPVYYITLPDQWLGLHAKRAETAVQGMRDAGHEWATALNMAQSLALLEGWNLPDIPPRLEGLDVSALRLDVIGWVTDTVLRSYNDSFFYHRGLLNRSQNGQGE